MKKLKKMCEVIGGHEALMAAILLTACVFAAGVIA